MAAQDIVFFDGVCNLCNSWVDFLIKKQPPYKFSTLQGTTAEKLIENLKGQSSSSYMAPQYVSKLDTVIYFKDGRLLNKSTAAIQILADLGGPWKIALALKIVPKLLADPIYDLIASSRYKFFGLRKICRVPTAEDKKYLLP